MLIKEEENPFSSRASSASAAVTCPVTFLDSRAASFLLDNTHNKCAGAKLALTNKLCVNLGVQPQAGARVTQDYVVAINVGAVVPTTNPYCSSVMCLVNVH